MAAIQLNFTLRTSANCKTVHLLGSWDNYTGQLPLSKDSSKTGGWKGAFRFQSQTLKQGQRYWYYYIIDGYHVSHDPARDSVVEPTTGRTLNVLDLPAGKTSSSSEKESRQSRRASAAVPKGRPVEKSQIVSPRPCKPQETKLIRTMQFQQQTMEQIAAQFASTSLSEDSESDSESDSDADSDVPSLASSRSSNSSSPASSVSSMASSCSCERYGITRAGQRVKLDCGGSRCGYSDDDCSDDDDEEVPAPRKTCTRRHGMIMSA